MLDTPILFLIYNRPESTKLVFESIRQIRPKQLFVAADGPRLSTADDKEKCMLVREMVLNSLDWDCKVHTLFRDTNLGCGKAVSEAITWFFDQVEEGIILEDDTLPELGFFYFCQSLLKIYKNSNEIAIISGTNYLFNNVESRLPYYFSAITAIWGWATWRRTWHRYIQDSTSSSPIDRVIIDQRFKNKHYSLHFYRMLLDALNARIDTWDLQFSYFMIRSNAIAIVPVYNQVKNIGYEGTHAAASNPSIFINMPVKKLDLKNMENSVEIRVNEKFDRIALINITKGDNLAPSCMRRFINHVKSLLR